MTSHYTKATFRFPTHQEFIESQDSKDALPVCDQVSRSPLALESRLQRFDCPASVNTTRCGYRHYVAGKVAYRNQNPGWPQTPAVDLGTIYRPHMIRVAIRNLPPPSLIGFLLSACGRCVCWLGPRLQQNVTNRRCRHKRSQRPDGHGNPTPPPPRIGPENLPNQTGQFPGRPVRYCYLLSLVQVALLESVQPPIKGASRDS